MTRGRRRAGAAALSTAGKAAAEELAHARLLLMADSDDAFGRVGAANPFMSPGRCPVGATRG